MSVVAGIRQGLLEGRGLLSELRDEPVRAEGAVVVSGMLAEQLARQLGAGAEPGAVVAREGVNVARAEAVVRVIAGDPSAEDTALVRAADQEGIPVVLVQLWPQAEWTKPFVLSPFVVECKPGEGFPVAEIADRIGEAVEAAPALAARIPALQEAVVSDLRRGTVARAALLGLLGARGPSRPALAREQVRALSRLRALDPQAAVANDPRSAAGIAALVLTASFAFRAAARATRGTLPAPLVNAAVAAGGTWAVTRAVQELQARISRQ
ncbi:MAG TPA: hypothetical protein VFG70_00145 [Gaiellaceae bacterium]|nr:hypothetical protein [Gaiellaceae bacterium]